MYLPPDTKTLSEFTAKQLTIALCPDRFCRKFPSGNFHCLILSGDAEAKVNLQDTNFTQVLPLKFPKMMQIVFEILYCDCN